MPLAVWPLRHWLRRCAVHSRPGPRGLPVAGRAVSSITHVSCLDEFDVDFRTQLGVGAMGAVYPAQHRRTSENVAIKTVSPSIGGSTSVNSKPSEIADGIRHECEAFRRILDAGNHPFVVDLVGCFEGSTAEASERGLDMAGTSATVSDHEPIHYFVMERLGSVSLQDHIEERKGLTEEQAKRFSRAMCEGLAFLHANGIVHRDVKPSNALFSCQASCPSELKLIDFSHAGVGNVGEEPQLSFLLGTAGYAAPEVLGQGMYNERCDVYSFGCTVHAMLSNMRLPRRHPRAGIVMCLPDSVSSECREFVGELLAYHPEERPSFEEILRHPWLQGVDLQSSCGVQE